MIVPTLRRGKLVNTALAVVITQSVKINVTTETVVTIYTGGCRKHWFYTPAVYANIAQMQRSHLSGNNVAFALLGYLEIYTPKILGLFDTHSVSLTMTVTGLFIANAVSVADKYVL